MNKKTWNVLLFFLIICGIFELVIFRVWFLPALLPPNPAQIETAQAKSLSLYLTQVGSEIEKTPVFVPNINSNNWLEKTLNTPVCHVPCWENITPGVTALDEAIKIIVQISGIEINWLSLTPMPARYTKFAKWDVDQYNSQITIETKRYSDIVSRIDFYPGDKHTISVEDVISAYGTPDTIVPTSCWGGELFAPPTCSFGLAFEKIGMLTYTSPPVNMEKSNPVYILQPNTQVTLITLSSPGEFDNPQLGPYEEALKMPWRGYGNYELPKKQ